jgi:hypothetical protein
MFPNELSMPRVPALFAQLFTWEGEDFGQNIWD